MRIIARSVAVLGTTVAVAVTAFIPAASAATTTPGSGTGRAVSPAASECNVYQESDYSAEAYCGGTETILFRVAIACTGGYVRYGQWKVSGAGMTSYTNCPTNTFYIDGWVQTDATLYPASQAVIRHMPCG